MHNCECHRNDTANGVFVADTNIIYGPITTLYLFQQKNYK